MATAGVKIWDENGVLKQGPDTVIGSLLGTFLTGGANGSISNPLLSQGTPRIFKALPVSAGTYFQAPKFTISGNTISWVYRTGTGVNFRVLYGVS